MPQQNSTAEQCFHACHEVLKRKNSLLDDLGCLGSSGVVPPLQLLRPQLLDQLPRVDLDGALHLAHAVSSAGSIPLVLVPLLKIVQSANHSKMIDLSVRERRLMHSWLLRMEP